jgi:hypothetical protein
MLYYVGEINGAGHSTFGMFKFRTYIGAAASQAVHTLCANLHLRDDCTLSDSGEPCSAAIYATVETETNGLTLSGGNIAGIFIGYYVQTAGAAPADAYAIFINTKTLVANFSGFDGLFKVVNLDDIGAVATVQSGDATGGSIPIKIATTVYYLHYWTAAS